MEPSTEPLEAWRRLRQAVGRRATIIDLYELVARRRGLAAYQLPEAERVQLARSVMPIIGIELLRPGPRRVRDLEAAFLAHDGVDRVAGVVDSIVGNTPCTITDSVVLVADVVMSWKNPVPDTTVELALAARYRRREGPVCVGLGTNRRVSE